MMYGEVQTVERLTPTMVRVVLGGGDLSDFATTEFSDQYINAQFIPDGAPYSVPFDRQETDQVAPELRPRSRRYTVRDWDADAKLLTIDFVAHGDHGFAGRWAQNAQPGDRLQFAGPGGGYAPAPGAAWHLLVGDESALPAIAASIERLTPDAICEVLLVVDGPECELPLHSPAAVRVQWLHRMRVDNPDTVLIEAVEALDFHPGPAQVFVHGEAGEVRAIRKHLLSQRNIDTDSASISPYWRRDHSDEQWRQVKAQWLAEQAVEV